MRSGPMLTSLGKNDGSTGDYDLEIARIRRRTSGASFWPVQPQGGAGGSPVVGHLAGALVFSALVLGQSFGYA
ncbi:hypothetical protein COX94_00480 [Candidatus Nomurabacteria bacterium CG_4_10_14_0_2_um_filter_33_9]|uniref:Uncharacterized protein n=1 Tax=Candidatus Nomurabacteria bacterium CG_4_10_14_0_2_um_filter_33_9 TaxID=1974728 RepID=A0A2J0MGA8_9BACT|nr:MAG: hypothetical protein COX94_00480 [Candidatus Nomurabacteria bacterium CG_4_10_14_0_2_um_filter_33_9]